MWRSFFQSTQGFDCMAPEPMFLNKARMVRNANALLLSLAVAPVVYLLIGALVTPELPHFASDQTFALEVFFVLVGLSAANIGMTIYLQKRKTLMQAGAHPDPVGRTFLTMSTSGIFSETHAIYGLILTLLTGSILYGVGFSLVTWASLLWVRGRFKQNLEKLPDTQPYSTS